MKQIKISRSLGVLNRTYLSYISKSLSEKNLSYSDSIFLVNIGNFPGISQEELSSSLAIDKAAVARSVKILKNNGYVEIVHPEYNKRINCLFLTLSGKELFMFMEDLNSRWLDYVLEGLSRNELDSFIRTADFISSRAKTAAADLKKMR